MTIEFGAELIERYLRTRQVRYFRGHHDDEYFFLVNAYHGRLHVHLEPCGPDRRMVKISITAERYYPAAARATVAALASQWNASAPPVTATVFASSDPRLVGVVAARRFSTAAGGDFGSVVDQSIQSAIDLFGRLKASVSSAPGGTTHLLDAG
ncbi:hypothetical protein [Mycobacterium sp. DL592]|uniref:hypothetical protein n=1 Tax=Mycobacterium sp. DL592 TaxID=2675524 RepID=UPI001AAFCEA8|nr:hypothetical protein [Mycobacterium sp. DL592]